MIRAALIAALLAATPAAAQTYVEGGVHRPPSGWLGLCRRHPNECPELYERLRGDRRGGHMMRVELTPRRLAELREVTRYWNGRIWKRPERPGVDEWTINTRFGDCEEYVLAKRNALLSRGWPRDALRIAVGYTSGGVGHAVLIVRTQHADVVLDNLTNDVLDIGSISHRLIAVQSNERPGSWAKLLVR